MRTRSPVPAALTCTVPGTGGARHGPLTRIAFLEDILAHWSLHLIGIEELLESGSSGGQTNEALRDGRSQMGTRKEGECTVFTSAVLQGDPEPERGRRRGVLWGRKGYVSGVDQNVLGAAHTRNVL
jgi:hypothetical protein